MDLDQRMSRFRLASRELFNGYFRLENATASTDVDFQTDSWSAAHRFSEVQDILFEKLVLEPADLAGTYGVRNSKIQVVLTSDFTSIMVNRSPGTWDHPLNEVTRDVRLEFISFWDWDELAYRDNRYAHVYIAEWTKHPEVEGREALIETQYIRYVEG